MLTPSRAFGDLTLTPGALYFSSIPFPTVHGRSGSCHQGGVILFSFASLGESLLLYNLLVLLMILPCSMVGSPLSQPHLHLDPSELYGGYGPSSSF